MVLFLIVLAAVAVIVAIVALQNGEAVTLSFLVWQLEAPLALVILAATAAGLVIGGLIGFARVLHRWTHRQAERETAPGESPHADPPRVAHDHRPPSRTLR